MQDQILFRERWAKIIDSYLSSDAYRDIVLYSLGLADSLGETSAILDMIRVEIDECNKKKQDISDKRKNAGRRGGAPKGNNNASKQAKQTNQAKQANGCFGCFSENKNLQVADNNEITAEEKIDETTKTQNNCENNENADFQESKEKVIQKESKEVKERNENLHSHKERKIDESPDAEKDTFLNQKKEIVVDAPPSSAAPPAQLKLDAFAYMDDRPKTPTRYELFCKKVEEHAPWCHKNLKMVTEREMYRLLENHTPQQIIETICNLENRKDLRKKYTSLYRTLINWLKNDYGK